MGSNTKKESKNQSTNPIKKKKIIATTFAIAKLEKQ